jgi:uncharacterized membrane protein YgaE (UPF0421/DUF939 family)
LAMNLKVPTGILKEEICCIIDRIKKNNSIKSIEPRYSDLLDLYKKHMIRKIDHKIKIKNAIKKPSAESIEEKAAERKRVVRILKKFSATSFQS